ncbi:hypothetical protein V8E55_005577 [Tylopilus felleus]
MILARTKPRPSEAAGTTDIVTYRYNDELVYVPLARDYNQALSYARDAFRELNSLPDVSLSLSVTSSAHAQKSVGISAAAWPILITYLTRYQIIDVHVTRVGATVVPVPDNTIAHADAKEKAEAEPAPPYPSAG